MPEQTNEQTSQERILAEFRAERARQDEKWGPQDHPSVPAGLPTTRTRDLGLPTEDIAKALCDDAAARGDVTWAHIAVEELCEVVEAPTGAERREELVQLGAVITAWIENIDQRAAAGAAL